MKQLTRLAIAVVATVTLSSTGAHAEPTNVQYATPNQVYSMTYYNCTFQYIMGTFNGVPYTRARVYSTTLNTVCRIGAWDVYWASPLGEKHQTGYTSNTTWHEITGPAGKTAYIGGIDFHSVYQGDIVRYGHLYFGPFGD